LNEKQNLKFHSKEKEKISAKILRKSAILLHKRNYKINRKIGYFNEVIKLSEVMVGQTVTTRKTNIQIQK